MSGCRALIKISIVKSNTRTSQGWGWVKLKPENHQGQAFTSQSWLYLCTAPKIRLFSTRRNCFLSNKEKAIRTLFWQTLSWDQDQYPRQTSPSTNGNISNKSKSIQNISGGILGIRTLQPCSGIVTPLQVCTVKSNVQSERIHQESSQSLSQDGKCLHTLLYLLLSLILHWIFLVLKSQAAWNPPTQLLGASGSPSRGPAYSV